MNDFFCVNSCQITCVNNDSCDFRPYGQAFNLDRELANISLLALARAQVSYNVIQLSFPLITQQFVLELAQPFRKVGDRGVSWQEEHEIGGVFSGFVNYAVEIWKDVLQGILVQQVVACTSPRRRNEHCIELFV